MGTRGGSCCKKMCNWKCPRPRRPAPVPSPHPKPIGKTCPKGCKTYFDGCNTCGCQLDGQIGGCTKKVCLVQQRPFCKDNDEDIVSKPVGEACEPTRDSNQCPVARCMPPKDERCVLVNDEYKWTRGGSCCKNVQLEVPSPSPPRSCSFSSSQTNRQNVPQRLQDVLRWLQHVWLPAGRPDRGVHKESVFGAAASILQGQR